MANRYHFIFSGTIWWIASAIVLLVIIIGCFGGHRVLRKPFAPVAAALNPLGPLVDEEIMLRQEIRQLRIQITQEKRRCFSKNCTNEDDKVNRTETQPDNFDPVSPTDSSSNETTPSSGPKQTEAYPSAVVFILDSSVTMGLHVNTGPNIEKPLIEGLKKGDAESEKKLQDYLGRTESRRLDRAKEALIDILNTMPKTLPTGLVLTKDCDSTQEVPLSTPSSSLVRYIQDAGYGGGKSLALAFSKALSMTANHSKTTNIVIITDGADTCDDDLCKKIQALNHSEVHKIHLINMGRTEPFKCLLKTNSGKIYQPITTQSLKKILTNIVMPDSTV